MTRAIAMATISVAPPWPATARPQWRRRSAWDTSRTLLKGPGPAVRNEDSMPRGRHVGAAMEHGVWRMRMHRGWGPGVIWPQTPLPAERDGVCHVVPDLLDAVGEQADLAIRNQERVLASREMHRGRDETFSVHVAEESRLGPFHQCPW